MKTDRTVRNCLPAFRFQCPRSWDELTATADAAIRHCQLCEQEVYFCATDKETIRHAKAGHCIARELPHDSELPLIVLGRPEQPIVPTPEQTRAREWASRERGIDDAIKNARDSTRSCPQCGFPAPDWRVACRVCGFEIGRVLPESSQ